MDGKAQIDLVHHSSLNMMMRYVDADKEAMRKVVDLV
jgi:hypothetical protein